ncbi:MAG: hypothetical protein LC119_05680 [Burkholderiales bacterium]|nr:hypothetical protein [Burkholderiales bacterium]
MNNQLKLRLIIDGEVQAQCTQISVNLDGQAVRVDTLEGLAGKTEGAKSLEIDGNWAVPLGGLEFDFVTAIADGTYHEVQIPIGNKTIVTRGWFQSGSLSQSVNAATEASAKFIGELNAPQ